jgi:hypothetical protein
MSNLLLSDPRSAGSPIWQAESPLLLKPLFTRFG